MARASLDSSSIFEELPITLSNPLVLQALVYQLKVTHPPHESEFDALDLSVAPYLQRQVEGLVGHVEEMTQKQHDLVDVERSIARQKSSQTQAKQHKVRPWQRHRGGRTLPRGPLTFTVAAVGVSTRSCWRGRAQRGDRAGRSRRPSACGASVAQPGRRWIPH